MTWYLLSGTCSVIPFTQCRHAPCFQWLFAFSLAVTLFLLLVTRSSLLCYGLLAFGNDRQSCFLLSSFSDMPSTGTEMFSIMYFLLSGICHSLSVTCNSLFAVHDVLSDACSAELSDKLLAFRDMPAACIQYWISCIVSGEREASQRGLRKCDRKTSRFSGVEDIRDNEWTPARIVSEASCKAVQRARCWRIESEKDLASASTWDRTFTLIYCSYRQTITDAWRQGSSFLH